METTLEEYLKMQTEVYYKLYGTQCQTETPKTNNHQTELNLFSEEEATEKKIKRVRKALPGNVVRIIYYSSNKQMRVFPGYKILKSLQRDYPQFVSKKNEIKGCLSKIIRDDFGKDVDAKNYRKDITEGDFYSALSYVLK